MSLMALQLRDAAGAALPAGVATPLREELAMLHAKTAGLGKDECGIHTGLDGDGI